MAEFADGTKVPISKSREDIEKLLFTRGADQFGFGWDGKTREVLITFRIDNRLVRMRLPLPLVESAKTAAEERRRWRVLFYCLKFNLVAVDSGLTTVEEVFHPYIVLPNDQTMYEWSRDQIKAAYDSGTVPPLLPGMDQATRLLSGREATGKDAK